MFKVDTEFALHEHSEQSDFPWHRNLMRISDSLLLLIKLKLVAWLQRFFYLVEMTHGATLT